jgi:hypothetical protein
MCSRNSTIVVERCPHNTQLYWRSPNGPRLDHTPVEKWSAGTVREGGAIPRSGGR